MGIAAPAAPTSAPYRYSQVHMGVDFRIQLYAPDEDSANNAAAAAFRRIAALDDLLSDYDRASELSRLSASSGQRRDVPVGDDLWYVLERSQRLARQTDGAFDVTAGPYVRLWRRARRSRELPSAERLAEAAESVGYELLKLDADRRTATLAREGMRLDLGGVAKGYAVDEALRVLREQGITRALVDAGGDLAVGEAPPGEPGWRIGVAPLAAEAEPERFLILTHRAVATSGDAFQSVEIGGRRYSHIVDPRTGVGLTTPMSVTVVAPDCATADSLATAVSVLGPEQGMALVEKTAGAAALVVREIDGRVTTEASERLEELPVPSE